MKFNFDEVIDRRNTASVKWDLADELFRTEGILPMWVADMDFRSPPAVIEALHARAAHGVFGYTACMASYYEAVIGWMKKRHDWDIARDWIVPSPGVVPALSMLVQALTGPVDRVILQTPVYYPFMAAIEKNGREILRNPLTLGDGRYRMDFDGLEQAAADPRAKLIILCSPHNPVGRVWAPDELRRLGEICIRNGVLVISDEIHGDLMLRGKAHMPFASLGDELSAHSITCTAPSKTFNLPGLQTANIIIPDEGIRKAFSAVLERNGIMEPNAFGPAALEAAYRHGEEWLEQLLRYIEGNLEFLKKFLSEKIPRIKVIEPDATYLVWLDCRGLGLDRKALKRLIRSDAKVALDEGHIFGSPEGDGFERVNIACPRSVLEEGLLRIERAVKR